jgi:ATP-dependent helicase/DNAse subunit B
VPFETLGLAELEEAAPAVAPERFSLRVAASYHDSAADPRVAHALARTCTSRGRLADEALRARLAERRVFSATELEAYAQCPYKWFYERVVRPEGIDGELGAMEQGSLAHRVLRRVYERLPQNTGSRRVTRDTLEMSLELADAVFAEEAAPPRTPPALTLMEEEELRRVLRTVRELLVSDADFLLGFEPTGLEVSFGREDEPEADLGEFALKGSIDRVDLGAGGLVIMDYKRGGEKTPGVVAKRRLLQLPLYAAVAAERFDQPVVAAFYRYLGARGRARGFYLDGAVGEEGLVSTDRLLSAEEVRGAIAVGLEAAKRAVEGIRRADIAPDDPAEDACKYCSAASFCPRGR